jgi:hypothetical protein
MLYAEGGSGRSHRPLTASAKVLDPSNTAHALSSHQEAQKRAIKEARLRGEAEKQHDNELPTPVASSSNLSAPASPSVSRPTSGKTSNVNLELFHMIFNNPGNGTYF